MLSTILLLLFSTNGIAAWSGILMDGSEGNTQLYVPGNPPINTPNVNFGLSHRLGQAAVMLNGRAYFTGGASFIGGQFANGAITNAVTIFNPSTNTSTIGAPLNVARWGHAATVVGDTIIVCGGSDGSTALLSCEQYNPSIQKWNMITSLPTPPVFFVMTTLNNRAYTFGGSGACSSAPPVYMFDGQNWESRSSIAGSPYWAHAGVALDTNRVLICGGQTYKGGNCQFYGVSDCFIYSASSNLWTQAASMAQIRCGHSMVMFEGKRSNTVLKVVTIKLQIRYTYSGVIVLVAIIQQLNYIHLQLEE
jgi:N-acetylneuraminic acid mutarotase